MLRMLAVCSIMATLIAPACAQSYGDGYLGYRQADRERQLEEQLRESHEHLRQSQEQMEQMRQQYEEQSAHDRALMYLDPYGSDRRYRAGR